jgi:hypothetical protein
MCSSLLALLFHVCLLQVVLAEPVSDKEWLKLADADSSGHSSGGGSVRWVHLKTGGEQRRHPHARHCDRNVAAAEAVARQQVQGTALLPEGSSHGRYYQSQSQLD